MPRQLPEDLRARVVTALQPFPQGADINELFARLAPAPSRRSLQRKLAEWSAKGAIRAEGQGKGRRYFAPPASATPVQGVSIEESVDTHIRLSAEAGELRERVRRPIEEREPVGYRRALLDEYQPNTVAYLPETLVRHLHRRGRSPQGQQPAGTYARALLSRLMIDLSWASSRLEGNTYSLLDTQRLIEEGKVAPGKDAKETQMILNHKAAIELLVDSADEIGVNRYTILNLHAVLADNLLEDPRQVGRLRATPVAIGASKYLPTAIPQLIEELFSILLEKAAVIADPFEQAFFLMVHLPYLQPFVDVNKRTSRLAANIPLIRGNLVPLSFVDVPEQIYIDGLIGIYEFNRVELLRDVFAWAYERSCLQYKTVRESLPEPDPFRLQYRTALIETVGEMVRRRLAPTLENVASLAVATVPQADLDRFCALVLAELADLHEGNIARFRLRPAELREWQARQHSISGEQHP